MMGNRRQQAGMALVLALMAVSFLVAVTVQLIAGVDRQVEASVNLRDAVRLDAMVTSGLSFALASLMADLEENQFDGPHDSWHTFDAEKLAALAGGLELTITVDDLSGRLQLDALVAKDSKQSQKGMAAKQRQVWLRLLTSGRFAVEDEDQATEILDAISDWLDKDDSTRDQGAESGYYRGLDSPYVSRNGSVDSVHELLFVKGVTSKLLYGDEEHEGLAQYLSIVGDSGKININTAPKAVLQALAPGLSEEIVQELVDFREDKGNSKALASEDWYQRVIPGDIILDKELITVASELFFVKVQATFNNLLRSGEGIVSRSDGRPSLASWKVD